MTLTHEPAQPDQAMSARIEELATKSTEGALTVDERAEYEGYVQANKFVAALRRQALKQSEQEV